MTWRWDELTAHDFPGAVEAAQGVCLLPFGVLEKHGEHLPLGTDVMTAQAVAQRAAALEPAVVFPDYYFGQIYEARHQPGTVAIRHELLISLLENVCDEIGRNGFRKILILNGHGGNEGLLNYYAMVTLERQHPYTIYIARLQDYLMPVREDPAWKAMMQSEFDEHGGEVETSELLALRPDLVKMEDHADTGQPLRRLAHLPHAKTGIFWYADFPHHYAGDATHATAEKGEFLLERLSARVAEIIRAVKVDTAAPALEAEFHSRTNHQR